MSSVKPTSWPVVYCFWSSMLQLARADTVSNVGQTAVRVQKATNMGSSQSVLMDATTGSIQPLWMLQQDLLRPYSSFWRRSLVANSLQTLVIVCLFAQRILNCWLITIWSCLFFICHSSHECCPLLKQIGCWNGFAVCAGILLPHCSCDHDNFCFSALLFPAFCLVLSLLTHYHTRRNAQHCHSGIWCLMDMRRKRELLFAGASMQQWWAFLKCALYYCMARSMEFLFSLIQNSQRIPILAYLTIAAWTFEISYASLRAHGSFQVSVQNLLHLCLLLRACLQRSM